MKIRESGSKKVNVKDMKDLCEPWSSLIFFIRLISSRYTLGSFDLDVDVNLNEN